MAGEGLKLQFVRVYRKEQRMDVALFDSTLNGTRLITYRWHQHGAGDIPPKTWYSSVIGEVRFQQGQELARRQGRLIPR